MRRKNKVSQPSTSKNHGESVGNAISFVGSLADCVIAVCAAITAVIALGKKG